MHDLDRKPIHVRFLIPTGEGEELVMPFFTVRQVFLTH